MEGGIFLLLCVLALFIGSRARNTRNKPMSEKAVRNLLRLKTGLIWASLVLIVAMMLMLLPSTVELVLIARDTHFDWDTLISVGLVLFGFYTIYAIVIKLKQLRKLTDAPKKQ
jgi:cell division septal protein FtsQ